MLVDAHVHLLPARLTAAIRAFFGAVGAFEPLYPCEPLEALALFRAAGVERCWSLPYVRRAGAASALNRWMAETFAGEPSVVGGATVHPDDDVPRVLDEALGELGLRVVKLHCSVGDFSPDDARLDPLWKRVSERGNPVIVHAGHAVDGTTTAREIEPIGRVAERFPEARVVLAHCGNPAIDAGLSLLRRARSVYADLTPVIDAAPAFTPESIQGLERRLLFGSDAPNGVLAIDDLVARVRALALSDEDKAAILGGTAEQLLEGL